jgi:DNA-directed RNA polymerase specialized sigma24 family protein
MNNKESRAFLKGEMDFTPQRMMRYIRSRARLATDEDIEDILQNALVLVTLHFDPGHPDAKLAPYCLGACNKAIAQNLERYHKVALKRRADKEKEKSDGEAAAGEAEPDLGGETAAGQAATAGHLSIEGVREAELDGTRVVVKTIKPGKAFDETPSTTSQYRTTSLDSMFDDEDGRTAEDFFTSDMHVLASGGETTDPAGRALINDLIEQILKELPSEMHRTCFVLKYVEGYKREDLIECLKMDAKSIDTIDKKIVRTLKAFKDKMDQDEARC